ncbi:hypothetical protein [Pseudanabaena sp. FACHB-2040]|nr:hypothetical protein [Pseudanabaena sp. FACHB-2040]
MKIYPRDRPSMDTYGSWQDWALTIGYVTFLTFIAYQVLKPPEK